MHPARQTVCPPGLVGLAPGSETPYARHVPTASSGLGPCSGVDHSTDRMTPIRTSRLVLDVPVPVSGIVIKNNIFTASQFFRHACVSLANPSSVRCRRRNWAMVLVPDPVRKVGHVQCPEDGLPFLPMLPGPAVLTDHVDESGITEG